jgi:hypothetical protein
MILPDLDANETIYETADRMYDWLRLHGFAVTMLTPDDLEVEPKQDKINRETLELEMQAAGLNYIEWLKEGYYNG